eukprot:CAMPEP_0119023854 /NCGR_PEP_ID=MMETSP1176-20130426/30766_1 /TAXON_ID=265551 /ORGANISM="Synedropsis recta cf, Strain CCMP1620" /LENGTH=258 /DNA_ID=CAMNT_0006979003 /DNA_START=89 /DNA_END=862 /DNA_ORIENTATION=-
MRRSDLRNNIQHSEDKEDRMSSSRYNMEVLENNQTKEEEATSLVHETNQSKNDQLEGENISASSSDDTTNTTTNAPSQIPRIIHFVYVSQGLPETQPPFHDQMLTRFAAWREMNPKFEIMMWDNARVWAHFPRIASLSQNITQMAWVADLVRYQAVLKFGGIYMDQDFTALRPLEPLVMLSAFAVCVDPHTLAQDTNSTDLVMNKTRCKRTCNGVFGAPKGHPALKEVVQISMSNTEKAVSGNPKPKFNLRFTGPIVW